VVGGVVSRICLVACLAGGALLACAGPAQANHSLTDLHSTGPNGGNGAVASNFRGASADGTRVFVQTSESLVSSDTDSSTDVYERSNGQTTLISTGPNGGNGAFSATFLAASQNGARVFFRTAEKLVGADTDSAQDIYERANGSTTLISTGPAGGGNFNVVFDRITPDGSSVFFDIFDPLVSADLDTSRDVYRRSGSTTTLISTGPIGGSGDFDAFFNGMSDDGAHVFFDTDEALVSSDFDVMHDVYERFNGTTTHLSIGPAGGNGNLDFDYDAFFAGVAANGTKAWIKTDEALTFDDVDTFDDVYELSGSGISRISFGAAGGNGAFGAFFDGASDDGSRVFLDTTESLDPADTDSSYDVYERSGGQTVLLSTGPKSGNGAFFAAFRGATPDGSHVFFETYESLTGADTDANQDVYDRSGGQTTLVSTGPLGGNAEVPASFTGSSTDASRVFFTTSERLIGTDIDIQPDVYERFAGQTTTISAGTGDFPVLYDRASEDGTRVFFETAERLLAADTDSSQDVYGASVVMNYVRPRGATPFRASLVPAYQPCAAPNRAHGAPLAFGSCSPPTQASGFLTVGSPDANGKAANSSGFVRMLAIAGNASTLVDEADAKIDLSITDVRRKSDLADYTGELQLVPTWRITDRRNGSVPIDPGTVSDLTFPVTVPCVATPDLNVGSTCSISTTADGVLPGTITEVQRTIIQLSQVKVFDGGADGLALTAGNTLFATQGVFVP
jgi:hypothetical protein